MPDDDVRLLVREFRESVAHDLDGMADRMQNLEIRVGDLENEVRQRISTMEQAILNAIRDLSQDNNRRFTAIDRRLGDPEAR